MNSTSRPTLRVDWCSHQAAKFAVENWHYSQRLPMPPLVKVGAWEDGKFIGCVLFGRGANPSIGKEYGLSLTTSCELVRIALTKHSAPVSKIAALAVRFLKKTAPGLRLVISYADADQGHIGAIYQAMNWVYVGRTKDAEEFFHEGRWKHRREVTSGAFGQKRKIANWKTLPTRKTSGKHKYLLPLDDEMRDKLKPLALPYPKRSACSVADSPTVPPSEGVQPDQHAPKFNV